MTDFEVTVVGGGVIGLSIAKSLSSENKKVLLLEKNNSFDSQFLFSKLKNKNKIYCRSINSTINELKQLNYDNTIILLQGAGDIKNILNTLKNNDSK